MQDYANLTGIFSISIVLIGSLIYYFGKCLGDTKIEEYDKVSYYISGLFFFLGYILAPFVLVILFNNFFDNNPNFIPDLRGIVYHNSTLLLLLQFFVLACTSRNVNTHQFLNRLGLLEKAKTDFKDQFEKKAKKYHDDYNLNLIDNLKPISKKSPPELFELIFYTIPIRIFGNKILLFIFSIILIYISYFYIEVNETITVIFASILLSFASFTMIALSVGFSSAYYPPAKIKMKDG